MVEDSPKENDQVEKNHATVEGEENVADVRKLGLITAKVEINTGWISH